MDRLREIAALGAEEILILGVAKVCVISHVNRNATSRLVVDVQRGQSDDRSAPKPDALKVAIKTSPALVRPASPSGAEPLRFPCGQG